MNLTVIPLLFLWTMLSIFLFLPILLSIRFFKGWRTDLIARKLVWLYGQGCLSVMSPFVRFKSKGFQNAAIGPPCILVINHLSFFDTYFLALLPFKNFVLVVRAWPFKMFWYTPVMRLARYMNVETLGWENILKQAKKFFSEEAALLFFPEGHRSKDGKLQRFFSGAFKLAVETDVKIVPLCICGTNDLFPPGRWWLEPARISLRALDPVDPKMFNDPMAHRKLGKYIKNKMAQCLEEMATETRSASTGESQTHHSAVSGSVKLIAGGCQMNLESRER